MSTNEQLYITSDDLYRIGNSESPKISTFRPGELTTFKQNGIEMVIANGRGISLYNKNGLDKAPLTGWVWEIPQGSMLPYGLTLIDDGGVERPGHFTLAPSYNMPMSRYVSLLEEVALRAQRIFKKSAAR